MTSLDGSCPSDVAASRKSSAAAHEQAASEGPLPRLSVSRCRPLVGRETSHRDAGHPGELLCSAAQACRGRCQTSRRRRRVQPGGAAVALVCGCLVVLDARHVHRRRAGQHCRTACSLRLGTPPRRRVGARGLRLRLGTGDRPPRGGSRESTLANRADALASPLVARFGPRPLILTGSAAVAGGMFWLSRVNEHSGYASHLLGPQFVISLGLGLVFVPLSLVALYKVAEQDSGVASSCSTPASRSAARSGLPCSAPSPGLPSRTASSLRSDRRRPPS